MKGKIETTAKPKIGIGIGAAGVGALKERLVFPLLASAEVTKVAMQMRGGCLPHVSPSHSLSLQTLPTSP
jgi:hypothetical protein